ncbi:MAG TPA: hypothetical protein VF503_20745 [Sphingobium sp.]|uniref:hypothetical protein n=1 Tax=Sphingobium sp. TaxID=1912891 RepID=UPI002ECFB438
MIHVETTFPNPGSFAEYDGKRWRVLQHIAGDNALLSLVGCNANRTRRAPLSQLIDPKEADDLEQATLAGFGPTDTRRALWIAQHLRNCNEVFLRDLNIAMHAAAREGAVPVCNDVRHVGMLLSKLGWSRTRRRVSNTGMIANVYVRVSQQAAA